MHIYIIYYIKYIINVIIYYSYIDRQINRDIYKETVESENF